jgi:hypothetical protein
MLTTDAISYAVIGLSHLFLIEKVFMHQPNNKNTISVQQATSRLLFEMYKYGPLRLDKKEGHTDLVGRQNTLCCQADPYLQAIEALEKNELVKVSKNSADSSLFSLTDKGYLVSFLLRSRSRSNFDCECNDCEEGLDKILWEIKNSGGLKLITNDDCEFPHLESKNSQMCLEEDSLLDAVLRLERMGIVRLDDDMSFKFTKKGQYSAQFTLLSFSKHRSRLAQLN